MKYSKPPLSIQDQINLWKSRGLIVPDEIEASHYLENVGYYRISGYTLPFQQKTGVHPHQFKPSTQFNDILNIYRFDCNLRALVMVAIEKIELSFRTRFSNTMAIKYNDPFWYMRKDIFEDGFNHANFLQQVAEDTGNPAFPNNASKGMDVFLKHFYSTYSDPKLPPSRMIVEVTSFSTWCRIFPFLKLRSDKKEIADKFQLPWQTLASWVHAASHVRNICAHHGRLWNREFTITPTFESHPKFGVKDNTRFYAQSVVLGYFMKQVSAKMHWGQSLLALIKNHHFIDPKAMGFPPWAENAVWFYEI